MKSTSNSAFLRLRSVSGMRTGRVRHTVRSSKGSTLPEYVLMIALLSITSISSIQYVSGSSASVFYQTGAAMNGFGSSAMVATPGADGGPQGGPSTSTGNSAPGKGDHASYQTDGGGTTSDIEGDESANYSDPQSGAGSNKPTKG